MSLLTSPSTFISNKKFPIIFQEKVPQFYLHPKKKLQLHDPKYISTFIHLNQVSSKRKGLLSYPVKCSVRDNSENTPEEGKYNAGDNSENTPEEEKYNTRENSENTPEKEKEKYNTRENSENRLEEGKRAMETVQKLYNSIKNKNLNEISDIIGEECRCISNVASSLKTFYGKEQVTDFFSSIIKLLDKDNFTFIISPTTHDGTTVGVAWHLVSETTRIPVGKGFGVYMFHKYKSVLLIRNVEMYMDPLFKAELVRLKILSFLMRAIQKMSPPDLFKGKMKQAMRILFTVLLIAALLYSVKKL